MRILYFNSTMVRLKAYKISDVVFNVKYFNSTMVRLKERQTVHIVGRIFNFNSTMVRLKDKDISFNTYDILISIPLWFD